MLMFFASLIEAHQVESATTPKHIESENATEHTGNERQTKFELARVVLKS